ncbi:glycosyltransferase family 9 protein [Flavobacterium sp. RHBU_24]|uniref:glycosyltransferase family 9 protein n=1 Tax=Flavobacterium sp. RHBU_24 TaxID=3391185 RepID=UPI003984C373
MPHTKKKGTRKHLLLLRFSAMGDVAMTVPLVSALAAQYPDLKITVVTRASFKSFFEGMPNVAVYETNFDKQHKGLMGLWRLYRELRGLHVYAVADLHNVLRSKVITFLFKRRGKKTATTDKMREARKALTAEKNKRFEPIPAVIERHAITVAQLGFPVTLDARAIRPALTLSEDVLAYTGHHNEMWIGIAPFAQHRSKVYPRELMQEVISGLAIRPGTKIFLFGGGRDEEHQLKKFAEGMPNVLVAAGNKLSMKQELQIISNLDVMLSMDSGNGHLAAMYGVKVISLWGATHPYAGFAPFNQPLSNSLTADRGQYPLLPTSVYGNKNVPGYEDAMHTITPQMVISKVESLLAEGLKS